MTKQLIGLTKPPARKKPFSEMSEVELTAYCDQLIDGGLFKNVPGPSSQEPATPDQSED